MSRLRLPKVGHGKAWGNTLIGGYKTQRRNKFGEFSAGGKSARERYESRRRQVNADRRKAAIGKVAKKASLTDNVKAKGGMTAGVDVDVPKLGSTRNKFAIKGGIGAGTVGTAAALIATGASAAPFLSVSRKAVEVGIAPQLRLGKNYSIGSSHSIKFQRTTDDAYDKAVNYLTGSASDVMVRAMGGKVVKDKKGRRIAVQGPERAKVTQQVADNIMGRSQELKVGGKIVRTEAAPAPRRWRVGSGAQYNQALPGSPPIKAGKAKRKPGKRTGVPQTVTGSVKGKPAVGNARPARRKKKANKKAQNRRGRTYTK